MRISHIDLLQPDLGAAEAARRFLQLEYASPEAVLVLLEVTDTTVRTDLGRKARIYATAGVQEY